MLQSHPGSSRSSISGSVIAWSLVDSSFDKGCAGWEMLLGPETSPALSSLSHHPALDIKKMAQKCV